MAIGDVVKSNFTTSPIRFQGVPFCRFCSIRLSCFSIFYKYYINYTKGQDITNEVLNQSEDYTGGNSADIELWKKNDTYNITESITDNGTHYFWVKDILGNTKSAKITINNIDRRIDEVQLTATESSKGNIATLIGTSQDKQAGLVG